MTLKPKLKRPVTVWLAQGLLLVFLLVWLVSLIINLVGLARNGSNASVLRLLVGMLFIAGYGLMLLIAFLGLVKRRMYGKWLGVVSLSFIWLVVVYIQIRPPRGPYERFEYNNSAEVAGAVITGVVISSLFLIVILRLAFAKKVDRFFRDDESIVQEDSRPSSLADRWEQLQK
jgi:hypothetical protein